MKLKSYTPNREPGSYIQNVKLFVHYDFKWEDSSAGPTISQVITFSELNAIGVHMPPSSPYLFSMTLREQNNL